MKKIFWFLLIISAYAEAQVTWNPTFNISNTPAATSDYHSVYSDDFGYYYVVWGDNGEIKFRRSTDYGETWLPNVTIYSSSNVCGWPVVKADYNYVYVVYHQLAGDYEILFQYSTDFGQTWSSSQGLSGMDSGSITPQLSVSVLGTLYVVWEQKINNIADIYFIKSTDHGLTWSSPQNLSNTPTSYSRWVQLESSGNTIYCAWLESTTYPASDIYFSKSTDGGGSWTTPLNITNDVRPQNRIYMTLQYDDQLYIASDDIITFNFDEIYLIKSSDGGSSWTTPVNITNNSGNSNTPCLEVWGDFLYFTWADNSHTAPAYDNMDVFFKWSSDNGVTWQDSINLSNNSESSSRPRICSGVSGPIGQPWIELTVVWYDYSTGDAEILARRGVHNIIPVELTSFNAEVKNNIAVLNWTTATETNNSGFEIQRIKLLETEILQSTHSEQNNWEDIGFVTGNGTTTEPKSYSFTDQDLGPGTYKYRLKQIDFDGSFVFSQTVTVETISPLAYSLFQNFPNPFNPRTVIKYQIPNSYFVSLKMYDVLGNEVATLVNEVLTAGYHEVVFSGSELPSGTYFYRMTSGNFVETRKMILMK